LPPAEAFAGSVLFPPDLSVPPAQPEQLTIEQLQPIWRAAGEAYGVPWSVLAAINKIESNFGQNMGPSSAGAVGWMQFMPATWQGYGTDGDGDGIANPWDPEDGIYSAARYLAASGAATHLRKAIFSYNHADWYVNDVLDVAAVYDAGGIERESLLAAAPPVDLTPYRESVADAEAAVDEARADVDRLEAEQQELIEVALGEELISERLDAQRMAAEVGAELGERREELARLEQDLQAAEDDLAEAGQSSAGGAFAPASGFLASTPSFQGEFVFPVGGGPELVSVARDHHDYPAADIAAPAGSPVYALSIVSVLQSWSEPTGRCGIGATVQTQDGREWTYCHLAYLDAGVTPGAELAAGRFMGLVGTTGHSTGPHLHLQFQPATSYPQEEQWFSAFAGTAFRWQGEVPAVARVFAVAPAVASALNSAPAFAE
jgi:murein DD-endopeptidase MepM/ murein hydrolase activator NlpD